MIINGKDYRKVVLTPYNGHWCRGCAFLGIKHCELGEHCECAPSEVYKEVVK